MDAMQLFSSAADLKKPYTIAQIFVNKYGFNPLPTPLSSGSLLLPEDVREMKYSCGVILGQVRTNRLLFTITCKVYISHTAVL